MTTKKQLETYDLTHRHGGNGWAMCQDLDGEYCRVTSYANGQLGSQAFLAAKSQLSITRRPVEPNGPPVDILLPETIIEPLSKLRSELRLGGLIVVGARIRKP